MHRLAKKLQGWKFDWYVAISRGGLVPAALLAQLTGVKAVDTFCISTYVDRQSGKMTTFPKDFSHLQGKRVLVVDDIIDSGQTMNTAVEVLRPVVSGSSKNSAEVGFLATAAVAYRKGAIPKPDFFIYQVFGGFWIDFPWELNQRIRIKKEETT